MTGVTGMQRRQEQPGDRPQLAGQTQLPVALKGAPRGGQLAARDQQAQRDRQVKAGALFRQLDRRQIDRDTSGGKFIAGIQQRRAHALTAFPHHRRGQSHDREIRQTTPDMQFDLHQRRRQAQLRATEDSRQAHPRPGATPAGPSSRRPAGSLARARSGAARAPRRAAPAVRYARACAQAPWTAPRIPRV